MSDLSIGQQFTGLPIEDLVGGPLMAVTEANGNMARKQTQFILDTCFMKNEPDSKNSNISLKPIMIDMLLERGVLTYTDDKAPSIENMSTTMRLPLLTLIPLNTLGVDSASVNFEMEVKQASSEDIKESSKTKTDAKADITASAGWGPFKVSITGSVSYSSEDSKTHDTHYENSNSAKYSFSVHAGQLPMPKGVNTIIDAYSRSIEPIVKDNSGKQAQAKA